MITFLCLALALLVPLQHMAIAAYADDLEEMQRREELYLKAMKEIGTILQMDLSERKAIAEAHDIIERNEDGLMAAPARIRMIVYKNETFRRAVIQRIEEQGVEEFWREINESPRSVTELRGSEEVARSIEETLRRQAETLRRVADRLHRATLNSEQGYLGQPGSGANFGQVVLQQSVAALRSLGTLSCRAVEAGLSAVVTTAAAVEHPVRPETLRAPGLVAAGAVMGSSEHAPVATTAESAGHLPVDAVAVIVLTLGVLLALGIIVAVATNFGRDWSLPDDPYEICMDRAQTIFGRCIRDSRGDTATEQECNRQWLDSTADCAEKYLD